MKSKYETNIEPYIDKIAEWAMKGATAKEIAKKLSVSDATFFKYLALGRKGEEPFKEFAEAFTRACEVPDDEVEASLYKLACGYTVSLEKTFKVKHAEFDPVTGRKIAEYEELVKDYDETHVAANVEAQKFWLTNRRRDRWAYKPESETEAAGTFYGVVELPGILAKPGDEEEKKK